MNRKNWICLLLTVLTAAGVFAQNGGRVLENGRVDSKILKMERNFSVYLPAGYDGDERSYPVLYLLHGLGGDHTNWIQLGEVKRIADKAVAEGTATPMIIVMPDASEGRVGYFDDVKGDWNYEEFFFKELIPYVESHYRVRATKHFRAVAGLSMGGGGTLMYALHHPEMFSVACPLSAYLGPQSYERFLNSDGKGIYRNGRPDEIPEEKLKAYYDRYTPFAWIGALDEEGLKKLRTVSWYIDCGDDDFLTGDNCRLHMFLLGKKIPHQFRVRDGAHTWAYWRSSLPEVLKFCTDKFNL